MDQREIDERARMTPALPNGDPAACIPCGAPSMEPGHTYCQRCFDDARVPAVFGAAWLSRKPAPSPTPVKARQCTNDGVNWFECDYVGCMHKAHRSTPVKAQPRPLVVRLLKDSGYGSAGRTFDVSSATLLNGGMISRCGTTETYFYDKDEGDLWERVPAEELRKPGPEGAKELLRKEQGPGLAATGGANRASHPPVGKAPQAPVPSVPQPAPRPAPKGMSAVDISAAVEEARLHFRNGIGERIPTAVARAPEARSCVDGDLSDLLPDL